MKNTYCLVNGKDAMTDEIDSTDRQVVRSQPYLFRDSSRGLRSIAGDAHIVIGIDTQCDGVMLSAYIFGEFDATYTRMSDERLLGTALAKLLAELRQQLQGVSGSAVTHPAAGGV